MDRNLGATASSGTDSYGLYYQWGRKDPFPNSGSVNTVATSSSKETISYTVSNPSMFIISGSGNGYDWHYQTRNNYLWGNPTGYNSTYTAKKSIYDPCPHGYKVAPKDTWTRFTLTGDDSSISSDFNVYGSFSNGWWFYIYYDKYGTSVWYPAAGCRGSSDGSLSYIGSRGEYWNSSPNSASSSGAGNLYFYSSSVNPLTYYGRGDGHSVRCVQE